MSPSYSTVAAVLESAPAWIWKRSVPVSETGPHWTATKIGNALFPGWPLRISHLVTLRSPKAPITVCESALRRCLPPGKRFCFGCKHPEQSLRFEWPLGLGNEFLRHARLGNKWSPFSIWEGLVLPKWGDVLFRRLRSSYPLAGCSPAEPASVSLDNKTLAHLELRSMASLIGQPNYLKINNENLKITPRP
jgi:hypothetical protein